MKIAAHIVLSLGQKAKTKLKINKTSKICVKILQKLAW